MDFWLLAYFIIAAIIFHRFIQELPPINLVPTNKKFVILLFSIALSVGWLGFLLGAIILPHQGKK